MPAYPQVGGLGRASGECRRAGNVCTVAGMAEMNGMGALTSLSSTSADPPSSLFARFLSVSSLIDSPIRRMPSSWLPPDGAHFYSPDVDVGVSPALRVLRTIATPFRLLVLLIFLGLMVAVSGCSSNSGSIFEPCVSTMRMPAARQNLLKSSLHPFFVLG
jgi:hypothetical protein